MQETKWLIPILLMLVELVSRNFFIINKFYLGNLVYHCLNYSFYLGVVITLEQITIAISSFLESKKESLIKDRYKLLGQLLAQAKQIPELKWANGVAVKEELEKQV